MHGAWYQHTVYERDRVRLAPDGPNPIARRLNLGRKGTHDAPDDAVFQAEFLGPSSKRTNASNLRYWRNQVSSIALRR